MTVDELLENAKRLADAAECFDANMCTQYAVMFRMNKSGNLYSHEILECVEQAKKCLRGTGVSIGTVSWPHWLFTFYIGSMRDDAGRAAVLKAFVALAAGLEKKIEETKR